MKHWDAVLRITQYLRRVTERKEQSRTGVLHLRILVTVSLTLRQTLIVWILIVPLTTDVQSQDTVLCLPVHLYILEESISDYSGFVIYGYKIYDSLCIMVIDVTRSNGSRNL